MKRFISIVLTVLLLLSCSMMVLPAASAAPAALTAGGNYELVDENETLALYIDYSTGMFAVMNQKTQTVWYSNPVDRANDTVASGDGAKELDSLLSVEYLTPKFTTMTVNTNSASFVAEHNGDDIILSFYFSDISARFIVPIKLTLVEDYLRLELMTDSIKEMGTAKVLSVSLLQFFGAANSTDVGYALLTDGSGSLMEFNSGIQNSYEFGISAEGSYYGINPTQYSSQSYFVNWNETFRLPLIGMVKNGEAYLNIVESAAAVTETHAYISRYKNSYNTIFNKVTVRDTQKRTNSAGKSGEGYYYTDELPENYVGRYYFMDGAEANYVGMAEKYRNYLIEEKGMAPVNENIANSLCVSLYGAVKKSMHFLGIPYTGVKPLTTFAEAEAFVDRLAADQVDNVFINYLGWNSGGMETTMKTAFEVESKLGGKKAVNSLISKVNSIDNYFLSFDVNLQAYYKNNSEIKKFQSTAYGLNSSPVTLFRSRVSAAGALDKNSIAHQLLHPTKMVIFADKFIDNAMALDVKSFSFNSIGDTLYCAYNNNDIVTRDESAKLMTDIFTNAAEKVGENGIVNTLGGNAYAAPYVDNIIEAPVYGSHNNIAIQDVPFYQIVFRGYANMATDAVNLNSEQDELILKIAESGMSLYYLLMDEESTAFQGTSFAGSFACELDDHYDDMVANYKRLKPLYDAIGTSSITDHTIVSTDVRVTTYSNGATVYVNYGTEDATVNGVVVKANDFVVVGGANS